MKIALLTKYDDQAASTRKRFYQYQPYLENKGFKIIKQPLFNNNYLKKLYISNNRDMLHIAKSYLCRMQWLISKPDVDLIWLHCDLFPYMPGLLERLVTLPKKPIIYDFDDAIFHNYDSSSKWYVRMLLRKKLHHTLRVSKIAFCGNKYLAKYASSICQRTEIIPTVINTDKFIPISNIKPKKEQLRIGWIGTPTTFKQYLNNILPFLKDLVLQEGCKILIMGASKNITNTHPSIEFIEWKEEREVPFIQSLDIGIMPLNKSPWAKGKCGLKIIQYMACGIPVVASPVGVNSEIVEHGVNGFLADTEQEWYECIKKLLKDRDLRTQMGLYGREKIIKDFSLNVWGPRVSDILLNVLEDPVHI